MSSSKISQFKGLMAPTFTPFDRNGQIDYGKIEPYAKHLKAKGISAVLVNGSSGEGMSLSLIERKKVTEKWSEVCKKLEILMMVQISGCAFADVIELAQHASSLQVDAVLCLPELYFKPKTIEKLVGYLKDISVHCPKIPLYYYHIPANTFVDLPMESMMELAKKEIPSFSGIKYSSCDLEKAVPCLKQGQVFMGSNKTLLGSLVLGFTCAIMTPLNINPEISLKIVELVEKGKIAEAREQQNLINDFVDTAMKKANGQWLPSMKQAFNDAFADLHMGSPRKPL